MRQKNPQKRIKNNLFNKKIYTLKKKFNIKKNNGYLSTKNLIKIKERISNNYKIEFLDDSFLKKFPKNFYAEYEGSINLNEGDLIKAKFKKIKNNFKMHSVILIEKGPLTFFGILKKEKSEVFVDVSNKSFHQKFLVEDKNQFIEFIGSFVKAKEVKYVGANKIRTAKIIKVINKFNKGFSLNELAINQYQLNRDFPKEVMEEIEKIKNFKKIDFSKTHRDLSHISFVTIDPKDAKDHDDAIFISKDKEENENGFIILVSIADVSFYVKENSIIDKEAFKRGNSTYFPSEVIPMLPKKLSDDLCSLKKNRLRPCLTLKMRINEEGIITKHEIFRSIIKVKYSFNYEELNEIINEKKIRNRYKKIITDIYQAYKALLKQRIKRNPLNLVSEDIEIELDDKKKVKKIGIKKSLETHKIVEEIMITANNCVASKLSEINKNIIYRIHEKPDTEKIRNFKKLLKSLRINPVNINSEEPIYFNQINENQKNFEIKKIIHDFTLKSMKQARYSQINKGHFGLNLKEYVHFTSPIRRYSDLIIHRILIENLKNKKKDYLSQYLDLDKLCSQTSHKERVSSKAEKETLDRYVAEFMKKKIGKVFFGYVSDIKKNGIIVKLKDIPCEGFVHKKQLHFNDLFYDTSKFCLRSINNRILYNLGDDLKIKLINSYPLSGNLIFKVIEHN